MFPAVFLDRDGVLNHVFVRDNKPYSPNLFQDFTLYDDVLSSLNILKKSGYLLVVITNQPELVRGGLSISELQKMNDYLLEKLPLNDIFVCSHDNQDLCLCRKPKAGMILKAQTKWQIDLKKSYFIGDTWKDMEVGRAVGCHTILLDRPYNQGVASDFNCKNLADAANYILNSY